jgi:hypothetical protein
VWRVPLVKQEFPIPPEFIPCFCDVRVAQSLVSSVLFGSLFIICPFLLSSIVFLRCLLLITSFVSTNLSCVAYSMLSCIVFESAMISSTPILKEPMLWFCDIHYRHQIILVLLYQVIKHLNTLCLFNNRSFNWLIC